MDRWSQRILLTLALFVPGALAGAEDSRDVKVMVERINERYDDFFRVHDLQEKREERLMAGREDRRGELRRRQQEMEKARLSFVQARRPRASDEPLRLRWEAEQKGRREEIELLRRRYVEKRDTAEQYLLKGRAIPALQEFDLQDY